MGRKNRNWKEWITIITKELQPDQYYVEPFVGGANIIDKINHKYKIGKEQQKSYLYINHNYNETILPICNWCFWR